MYAQHVSEARGGGTLFPGFMQEPVDSSVLQPHDLLRIDPSTYPAVGRYVPDPKGNAVPGVKASGLLGPGPGRDDSTLLQRKLALLKKPRVPTARVLAPTPGARRAAAAAGRSAGLPPLGTDGDTPPATAARRKRPTQPPRTPPSGAAMEEDRSQASSSPSDVSMADERAPLTRYCISYLVKGPYTESTGYGTVLTNVYYQPPRSKEVGPTAEQINQVAHPPCVLPSREVRVQEDNGRRALLYRIGAGAVAFKVVLNTFDNAGMRHTPGDNWNLLWAKRVDHTVWGTMDYYQRVNHFPGTWGIGRKDLLHKNVSRFYKQWGEEYHIAPLTWVLPQDTKLLSADMAANPGLTYIIKPCASSCGKGIRLIKQIPQNKVKSSVVQRYIPDPFLVQERKFDLRIYVAVTGFDPLKIYIFDEGLVRFAAEKYPGPNSQTANSYAHLTNYSISKTAALKKEEAAASDMAEEEGAEGASGPKDIKWMLTDLKTWFYSQGKHGEARWKQVAKQVSDVIIKTFITVETDVCNACQKACKHPDGHGCFELFGFDLMLDESLKVYVLEANIMPSLATGNPMDKAVKNRLLSHLITLVGVAPYDREVAAEEEKKGTFSWSTKENNRTCTYINGKTPMGTKRECRSMLDSLTDNDKRMIVEAETELARSGGFQRVFPTHRTWEQYSKYFDVTRYRNELLARWEAEKEAERMRSMAENGVSPTMSCTDWDVPLPQPSDDGVMMAID